MGGLLLELQNCKKGKVNFWTPCTFCEDAVPDQILSYGNFSHQ